MAIGTAAGSRRRRPAPVSPLRYRLALLGPAFVAAVAYVDPGNFATDVRAGAEHGYSLLWAVVMANLMALLVQYLSAKLGLATGRNLPELMGQRYPRNARRLLWAQAEIVAMATDLAEFVGAALGLQLLFGVPLLAGGAITAVVAFGLLALQRHGLRPFERAVTALLALVALGFVWDVITVGHPSGAQLGRGLLPSLDGSGALTLTIGIVGATVMPHVIYLHSAVVRGEPAAGTDHRRFLLRWVRIDCALGLGAAGVVNALMLITAAALFSRTGNAEGDSLQATHHLLATTVGGSTALAFAASLLASGLSSSSVGTFAGQVVMSGLLERRVPLVARRALTMVPALVVLAAGVSVTQTLVVSQVVLSFGIPFALLPLLALTSRHELMGELVNTPLTVVVGGLVAAVIVGLNLVLLVTFVA